MATQVSISNYVAGNDVQLVATASSIDPADAIVKAWLTIKTSPSVADPGSLQKTITTALTSSGQITADGSAGQGNGTATFNFLLTNAETTALGTLQYYYDISVKTAGAKKYTSQYGIWVAAAPGITLATS